MSVQIVDSGDTATLLRHAGIEIESDVVTEDKKPIEPEEKKVEAKNLPEEHYEEDDSGLTEEQKKELTAKMQKAIGKKHRELKEAEEFAAAQYAERKLAEARAQELQRKLDELNGENKVDQQQTVQEQLKKPERRDYATDGEYIEAMIQFGINDALNKQKAAEEAARKEAEKQTVLTRAIDRLEAARKIVPDFDEVVSEADVVVPAAIAGYMQKSEMFAELGYHFAKNTDILLSIAKLPVDEQLVAIGKIESALQPFGTNGAKNVKTTSQNADESYQSSDETGFIQSPKKQSAPVIKPITTNGIVEKSVADMDIRETISDWAKKNARNFNVRKRH